MIKLIKDSNSSHHLQLGDLTIFFSYETPIAFMRYGVLTISENEWGVTTGKHLNAINPDKKIRIPHQELITQLEELI